MPSYSRRHVADVNKLPILEISILLLKTRRLTRDIRRCGTYILLMPVGRLNFLCHFRDSRITSVRLRRESRLTFRRSERRAAVLLHVVAGGLITTADYILCYWESTLETYCGIFARSALETYPHPAPFSILP